MNRDTGHPTWLTNRPGLMDELFEWCTDTFGEEFFLERVRVPEQYGVPPSLIRVFTTENNAVMVRLRWGDDLSKP